MKNEGTVTISTEEYNELRDFKIAMERGDTVLVITDNDYISTHRTMYFYKPSEAIKLVLEENNRIKQNNEKILAENALLNIKLSEKKGGGFLFWR